MRGLAIWCLCVCTVCVPAASALAAPALTVLRAFGAAPDGRNPFGALWLDATGRLTGTTLNGGAAGGGTIFALTRTGASYQVIHAFSGADGSAPYAGVVRDMSGAFWGCTSRGGSSDAGVVFRMDAKGALSVTWQFTGGLDGGAPFARLLHTAQGFIYGTASTGGQSGFGTLFRLSADGRTQTVLHHFASGTDGASPVSELLRDKSGALYGTTFDGGLSGAGTAFRFDASGAETILHAFGRGRDGANPQAGLAFGPDGQLFGTTVQGGAAASGTVFHLSASGKETVLHTFPAGGLPTSGLVGDASGNLYGVVPGGGTNGKGAVYRVQPSGLVRVLYNFTGGADGAYPRGGLSIDGRGVLYGTTFAGGAGGNGVVFRLRP